MNSWRRRTGLDDARPTNRTFVPARRMIGFLLLAKEAVRTSEWVISALRMIESREKKSRKRNTWVTVVCWIEVRATTDRSHFFPVHDNDLVLTDWPTTFWRQSIPGESWLVRVAMCWWWFALVYNVDRWLIPIEAEQSLFLWSEVLESILPRHPNVAYKRMRVHRSSCQTIS